MTLRRQMYLEYRWIVTDALRRRIRQQQQRRGMATATEVRAWMASALMNAMQQLPDDKQTGASNGG